MKIRRMPDAICGSRTVKGAPSPGRLATTANPIPDPLPRPSSATSKLALVPSPVRPTGVFPRSRANLMALDNKSSALRPQPCHPLVRGGLGPKHHDGHIGDLSHLAHHLLNGVVGHH